MNNPAAAGAAATPAHPAKPLLAPTIGALQVRGKTAPAVLTTAPNLVGLLLALRRRWMLALLLGLVGSALAAGVTWFVQKTTFTARTLLHVSSSPYQILNDSHGNQGDFNNYQRTQVALVRSRLVLNGALHNTKVAALPVVQEKLDPVAWLEKEIQVDFSLAPEILRIAMTGQDPAELTPIVDAVRDAYVKDIVYKEHTQQSIRLNRLKDAHGEYDDKLRNKKKQLDQLTNTVGSKEASTLALMDEIAVMQLHGMQNYLFNVQQELFKAQMLLKLEKDKVDGLAGTSVSDDVVEEYVKKDPGMERLIKALVAKQNYVDTFKAGAKDPNNEPRLQMAEKELEADKKAVEDLRTKIRPELKAKLGDQFKAQARMQLDGLSQQVAFLEKLEKGLNLEVRTRSEKMERFKKDRVSVEYLQDEISANDDVFKRIGKQMTNLEIELQAPERVTTLEEAVAVKDTDGRLAKSGMAGVAVFALIIFAVAFLEFRKRLVNTVDDVVRGLDLRLMGTLPAIPDRARGSMGTSNHPRDLYWQSLLTESVDAARTMLLHMAQDGSHQVVMVTSAVGGEGKTLLSCHLAASLARGGFRTLLVDCDLRRPAVHKLLNLAGEPGFSDVLRGQIDPADTLQAGPLEGLWVMASGRSDTAAFQALAKHRSKAIFKGLKEQFDFIVVDSAPILAVADSLLIGQCVDGVVFSILRDVSRLPAVYNAYERLATLRVHIFGAVVNGTEADYYRARYAYRQTPDVDDDGPDVQETADDNAGAEVADAPNDKESAQVQMAPDNHDGSKGQKGPDDHHGSTEQ